MQEITSRIVQIPRRLSGSDEESMYSLLQQSGYFGTHNQISEDDLRVALVKCPECLREWQQYSEDKRTSEGWYLAGNSDIGYEVGYFPANKAPFPAETFKDEVTAVAAFIRREIESVRLGLQGQVPDRA